MAGSTHRTVGVAWGYERLFVEGLGKFMDYLYLAVTDMAASKPR